jgi:hypothetical protein
MTDVLTVRLKIVLLDVEPKVVRRLDVPLDISLDRLHLAIQAAMGWTNSHLWEFNSGPRRYGPPQMDIGFGDGPLNAAKTTLAELANAGSRKKLSYTYDFGDSWEHELKIEKIFDASPDMALPALVDAVGACPPEDVGGAPGYEEFCAAIADPNHERHEEIADWFQGTWDATNPNEKALKANLAALSKRWSRKPAAKRPAKK